jgi:hypothetical protein
MQCQVPVITAVYRFTEFSVQVNHIIIRLVVVHDTAAASVQLLVLMSSWSPVFSSCLLIIIINLLSEEQSFARFFRTLFDM